MSIVEEDNYVAGDGEAEGEGVLKKLRTNEDCKQ